ncbi:HrpE/YscL family type III secretion apparatus protein [Chitinimonas lacunae]|uniref:Type 3 secretion system stator protein n=1 Tax=Chitinimonas lacunae TaxID=1963018 RepID=A0ABV8MPC3_9NEIS
MVFIVRQKHGLGRLDPGRKIVKAADYQAWRDSQGLLAAARDEAATIVAGAQAGYDAECRRGYEDGLEEAKLETAERMIETVGRTVDYFAKVENRMIELVMEAIRKIVADFDDRERVRVVVRNALSVVRNQKQVTLRIAPDQVETVKAALNELLAEYPGLGYLDIVADPRLAADACILESEIGLVEASVSGQIDAIEKAFARILGSRT